MKDTFFNIKQLKTKETRSFMKNYFEFLLQINAPFKTCINGTELNLSLTFADLVFSLSNNNHFQIPYIFLIINVANKLIMNEMRY